MNKRSDENGFSFSAYKEEAREQSRRTQVRQAQDHLTAVAHPSRKKDWETIVTGEPIYTQDLAPADCLVVKLLRCPYPNAIIEDIDTKTAMKVPGIEAIYTWKDVPQDMPRFTEAGQTYPEPSPYDRLILDRHMRHVGDVAAIVADRDAKAVDRALRLIRPSYKVLEPVLDFHKALDNPILVHPEDNWACQAWTGADNKRNLCAHEESSRGDVEADLAGCDVVIDRTYHTKAVQQAFMEPFCAWCSKDAFGRLTIVSSTQIVFHVRRNVANALGIPKSMIRVVKPRVGGGFGAKQTSVCEMYPAFVTWHTGKPSMIVYTRQECQTASSPRHEMEVHVRLGASRDGHIRAVDMYTLSNTGAYGEHGPTTVGLSGHKSIPLYRPESFRFRADVVYTNIMSAGAYRGYGATQGIFALESAVNELAEKLQMDPIELRLRNTAKEGDVMPAYFDQVNTSSALDRCILRVREMSDWEHKYPLVRVDDHTVRTMGMSIAMQGSGIASLDVGGSTIKLEEGGYYTLLLGSGDMGSGSDTTMSQIAAQVLECPLEQIIVRSGDTDSSPYDSGSYASSTAYLTGKATEDAARELRRRIIDIGARLLGAKPEQCEFDGKKVYTVSTGKTASVTLFDIAAAATADNNEEVVVTRTRSSKLSPPPYMAGVAEMETDLETGRTRVVNYYAAVDCGTPINPGIARVQAEGGILQAIGMALSENVTYNDRGEVLENSFLQYKIPARPDIGHLNVVLESSYENSGPFGAKSIGEVVIDTPAPAIEDAIFHATGKRFTDLPILPEQIAMAAEENK